MRARISESGAKFSKLGAKRNPEMNPWVQQYNATTVCDENMIGVRKFISRAQIEWNFDLQKENEPGFRLRIQPQQREISHVHQILQKHQGTVSYRIYLCKFAWFIFKVAATF